MRQSGPISSPSSYVDAYVQFDPSAPLIAGNTVAIQGSATNSDLVLPPNCLITRIILVASDYAIDGSATFAIGTVLDTDRYISMSDGITGTDLNSGFCAKEMTGVRKPYIEPFAPVLSSDTDLHDGRIDIQVQYIDLS
jgi:hypothetical protein